MIGSKKQHSLTIINLLLIVAMLLGGVALNVAPVEAAAGDIVITAPASPVTVQYGDTVPVNFTVDSSGKAGNGSFQILVGTEVLTTTDVVFTGSASQSFSSDFTIPHSTILAEGTYNLVVEVTFSDASTFSETLTGYVVVDNSGVVEIVEVTQGATTFSVEFTVDALDSTPADRVGEYEILIGDVQAVLVDSLDDATFDFDGEASQTITVTDATIPVSLLDAGSPYDLQVFARIYSYDSTAIPLTTVLLGEYEATATDAIIVDTSVAKPTLIEPNGGEELVIGSEQIISWAPYTLEAGATISLEFSANNGANWSLIAADVPNADYTWTVPAVSTTLGLVRIKVVDAVGNDASDASDDVFTIYAVDSTKPSVAMVAPADGATITAPVTLAASASDPESGINKVEFQVENGSWATIDEGVLNVDQYEFEWTPAAGTYNVRAKATNGVGLIAYSAAITITVEVEDETPPTVTLVSPASLEVVGFDYEFEVTATEAESGVVSMDIYAVDTDADPVVETLLCTDATPEGTESPFSFSCIADVPADTDEIKAVVLNGAGLEGEASAVVVVDLVDPDLGDGLLTPLDSAVLQLNTSFDITWDFENIIEDNLSTIDLELRQGGVKILDIGTDVFNDGSLLWTVAGAPASDYEVCMVVVDLAGNMAEDCNSPITIWGADNTEPTVSLTAPIAGNYAGDITFTATASDPETLIEKVEFFVGDVKVGEDLADPYTMDWDSTTVMDGTYTVKAVATNGVGDTNEASVSGVVVDNTPPVISDLSPSTAAPISGTVTFSVTAEDAGVGVASVAFEYWGDDDDDGVWEWTQITTDTVSPYESSDFDTTTVPDGWLDIRVTATDTLGNETILDASYYVFNEALAENTVMISLRAGWNLISLPLIPDNSAIEALLADLVAHDSVIQVVDWDHMDGALVESRWNGEALMSVTNMEDGEGYWVEMSTADVLVFDGSVLPAPPQAPRSYTVYAGWNLIGFKSTDPIVADTYLGEAGGDNMRAMYGFDESSGYYTQFIGSTELQPGDGYWLALSTNATIYP